MSLARRFNAGNGFSNRSRRVSDAMIVIGWLFVIAIPHRVADATRNINTTVLPALKRRARLSLSLTRRRARRW